MASSAARRSADDLARRNLEQTADLVAQLLAGRERSLAGGARVFVQGPYFRTLVAERRRDDILDQTFEAAEQLAAQWVFITDGEGTLLAKSDEPSATGDPLGRVPLVAGALRGQSTNGFGVSGDSLLFQATGVPIALPGGTPFGVLVATRVVDSALAADMKSATTSEIVFFVRDQAGAPHLTASTIPVSATLRSAVTQVLTAGVATPTGGTTPAATTPPGHEITVGSSTWMAQSASLATAGGDVIGGFLVMRLRDDALATLAGVRRSLAIAAGLGFLLALLAAWLAARSVTRPVRALANAMRRAADGNYSAPLADTVADADSAGEIGSLARAFDALLVDLRDKDYLSATTAAAVAVDESRRDADDAELARGVRRRSERILTFTGGSSAAASHVLVQRGHVLANRYRIESVVGSGGMGIVYRAFDRELRETVAVKLLRQDVVAADPLASERLKEEIRLARRITHRNVVRTHDLGESDGVPFITMEYVEGASLATVIRVRGSLPAPAILSLARQLMRALSAAHEQRVVHGDIKPQNLLIGPNGVLKVTDFGVARVLRTSTRAPESPTADALHVAGHVSGAIVGTPEYLAPESLIGGPATIASDLYAAGVVLHECVVGATPYGADTPMAFLANKLGDDQSRATRAISAVTAESRTTQPVDAAFEAILVELTQPDAARRPASAAVVLAKLAELG
jgi:serine/threonine-protein kinase